MERRSQSAGGEIKGEVDPSFGRMAELVERILIGVVFHQWSWGILINY